MPNSQRNQNRLKLILSTHQNGKLLEIGCGKGEFLRMASRFFEVEGIDVSQHAVETLQGWGLGKIRNEAVESSHLAENSYGVAAAFNVLEHIPQPQPVSDKLFSALLPGGILVGSVPFNAALLGRIHTGLTNIFDRTHCSTFSPNRWREIFNNSGFTRVRFFGEIMLGKNYNRYIQFRLWPWVALNLMFVCEKG